MAEYKKVEGLVRGLKLLDQMGSFGTGRARIGDLAELSGLHRTTVKRLLETLRAEGYVTYDVQNRHYYLALKARGLSVKFADEARLVSTSLPILSELQSEVVWPTELATPEGNNMVVRETTRRFSPFSFDTTIVGGRIPIVYTAVGRAYLGYSSENVRRAIAAYAALESGDFPAEYAKIEKLAEDTRTRGYGRTLGEWPAQQKFGGIAVPVQESSGRILGGINVVYLNSAISPSEAVENFLKPLQKAASRIEAALSENRMVEGQKIAAYG